MNEIINVLNKNRRKWEYYLSGYFNKLKGRYDTEDVYQEVLIKLFEKYQQNKINMNDLENYMFLTYRNCVFQLSKKLTNQEIQYDIYIDVDTYEEDYELFQSPTIEKIRMILGEEDYQNILRFYELRDGLQKIHDKNKPEGYDYTDKDVDRFYRLREKIKKYFNKNKKK